ncbi:MAG: prepilin peptidase [Candidatus Latescibacteria bacterium]|nr:prepilin peptidase [Candidatus Latescibacterota bacterium]
MSIEFLLYVIFFGLFGSMLGSFLNVVIYRLPRKESIVFPGSRCPECNTPIKYRDNLPVVGYLLLGGRCRSCSEPISYIYPLVELLTAFMVIGLFVLNWNRFNGSFFSGSLFHKPFLTNFLADVSLGSVLLVAFAIDLRHMIIPDSLNLLGGIIAVILSFRWGYAGIVRGIGGAFVGLAILTVMIIMGRLLFKREGIGMGDMKLAVVIGLFVGPLWSFITFIIAVFAGGIWGAYTLLTKRVEKGQEVPFGPFIAIGGYSVLFFKREIFFLIDRYLSLF